MSTPLDPTFIKIQGMGFMPFKNRIETSLASCRPPPKPVLLSIEAQQISRMNLELLEDNVAADEKIASLEGQIEQGRVVLALKHARICTLKGQLDSSRVQCTSLESQLCEQIKLADGYKARIGYLETELGDAHTTIGALEAEVSDKEADIEVLGNGRDMIFAFGKELATELHNQYLEFEDVRGDHALEIAGMKGRLIEMKDGKEQVEKALGDESARLAEVQAELDDTKERLQVEKGRVKELSDAKAALGAKIAELKWTLEEKEYQLGQAREKIASLELSLKAAEEKLSDARRTILQGCEDLAHAKEEHEAIQATLTDRCTDLSISLELTEDELTNVKSKLEASEGQLIDIEDFVSKQEVELQQKDDVIVRLQDEGEQAKADIEVRDAEIAELRDELGGVQIELEETRNGWQQETGELKERLGETEGELQDLRDGFGAFKEATQVKEVALQDRIDTLENGVQVTGDALAESENRINVLTIETHAQDATIHGTIVTLLETVRSGKEQRAAGLAKLQAVGDCFRAFKAAARANEEELEGRIDSLENEVKVKDAELGVAHDKVNELEDKISDLVTEASTRDSTTQNTIVALLLTIQEAEEQRQAGLAKQATLERRVEELTNDLRDRDNALEVTRTRLEASDNKVIELRTELANKDQELRNYITDLIRVNHDGQARFEEACAWSDDLDTVIEDKDRIIEESQDEISQLKARILELECQLTASIPPPIPTFEVNTIVPLDIDDTPSSDIVPACNLPRDADYFARIAPEATYESSHKGSEAGPDLLVPHSAKILLTRPQRRGVYKVRTPYSTTRLGMRNNIIVSTHDLVTGEIVNLGEGTQPEPARAPSPPVSTPGPQLSATAPTFTPSLDQSSVKPLQLRPSAPKYVPHPSAIQSPPLCPNVPSFTPCQPPLPLRVTQLRTSIGGFAPRPQLGGPPAINVPWSPIAPAFMPQQPSPMIPFAPTRIPTPIGEFTPRPQLGGPPFINAPIVPSLIHRHSSPVPPFTPTMIPTPIAPLRFAPYPSPFPPFPLSPSPFPPFARSMAPFVPTNSYANNNMFWTPPDRDNVSGAVRMNTDVRAGEKGESSPMNTQMEQQGSTGSSPLAQPITEPSITSIPSTDRVAQVDEDVIVSTHKSFPSLRALRARKDPSVVEPERISTRSSCFL